MLVQLRYDFALTLNIMCTINQTDFSVHLANCP